MKGLKKVVKFVLFKLLFRVQVIGKENIPENERFVFAPNHSSSMDGVWMWCEIPNVAIMAKKELFKFKPLGWFLKKVGVFPISRGEKDVKSIYHAVNVLRDDTNRSLLIFPEGTRNAQKKNVRAKTGAVYIAKAAKKQIIPVYITENKHFFRKCYIVIGKPYNVVDESDNNKDKNVLRKETDILIEKIYSLKEKI